MKTTMYYSAFILSLCLTVYVNATDEENQPGLERRFLGMPGPMIKVSKTIGATPFSPFMNPMMGYGMNPYTSAYGGFPMQSHYGMGMGLGGMGMGLGGMGLGGMGLGGMGMGLGGMGLGGMGLGGMGLGGMGMGMPSPLLGHSAAFGFGGMSSPYGMGPKILHTKVAVPGMGMGMGVGMGMGYPGMGMTPQFLSNLPKDEEPK